MALRDCWEGKERDVWETKSTYAATTRGGEAIARVHAPCMHGL